MMKLKKVLLLLLSIYSMSLYAYDVEVDGIYYNLDTNNRTAEVTYNKGGNPNRDYSGSVTIPSSINVNNMRYSVASIGESSFSVCRELTSITIPNSVVSIGNDAFAYCSSLTSVIIPTGVTFIDHNVFRECSGLISITIPNSVTFIGNWAFSRCSSLTSITIPGNVTSIGTGVLLDCSNLTSIIVNSNNPKYDSRGNCNAIIETSTNKLLAGCQKTFIPNDVSSISDYAFYGCSGLTSLPIPNSVTSIGNGAFYGCTSLTSMSIPNSVISIGHSAFGGCSGLNSIIIPSSVISIGNGVFGYCNSLSSITVNNNPKYDSRDNCNAIIETSANKLIAGCPKTVIPNSVTSIGAYAFQGCCEFTSIIVPNSVSSIGDFAFDGCSGLTSIIIPNSVTSIGDYAFVNCSSLSEVNSNIEIPFAISTGTFSGIQKNATLYVPKGTKSKYQAFSGWTSNFKEIVESGVSQYSLSINSSGNGSVTYNGSSIRNSMSSFTVDEGTSAILTFTPDNGYQLGSVKVGSTDVTSSVSNNKYTISNITANTTVTVTFEATQSYSYDVEVDGIYYNLNTNNKTAEVTNKTDNGGDYSGSVTIPSSINVNGIQYSVTSIGPHAFSGCRGLTSITIPNSVTSIDDNAFRSCSGLTSLLIPNNVTSIGDYAFDNCSGLTSIIIPNSVTSIGDCVFCFCSELTSISVDSGNPVYDSRGKCNAIIETNTNRLIQGCKFTVIPNSVTTIDGAFFGCSGLTSIVIPNSVTTIGEATFNQCSSLTSITIPNSVTNIGHYAFLLCESLSTVISNIENPFTIYDDTFWGIPGKAVLFVPKGTKSSYQAFSGWTLHFKDVVESGVSQYSLSIDSSGNGSVTYNGSSIRNSTSSFTVDEGTSATLTFTPDNGYRLASVKVGNTSVLSNVKNNQYTISNITANVSVAVEFAEYPKEVAFEGVNYTVASYQDKTVTVAKGTYGQVLTVPATFNAEGETWTVTGIDANALSDSKSLAAIIWNPKVGFTGQVSNPNLLLYVTSADYVPSTIKNVVINNKAASITLTDATEGNDFYCPQEFTAQRITYSHYYGMTTGIHESRGWETIALPFDVDKITHSTKGTLVPFASWNSGGSAKPFWLYEYGAGGFKEATAIHANTPYIISMPNNDQYLADYRVNGTVTFSAENVVVKKSENIQTTTNGSYTFVPNFVGQKAGTALYVLNVSNNFATNTTASAEGSVFVRNNRAVHPFEAYMTTQTSNAKPYISVFEDVPTGIRDVELLKDQIQSKEAWYTLEGQKMSGTPEKKGVYIHNGKKTIVR